MTFLDCRYLPQVDCRMFHSRQKNYRKLALRKSTVQVQLYFPLMTPVAKNFNMPQTKQKKKHSRTAVQSLKRLIIPQYNLSLKLTQNCYCNDFSPALPYQWLLLVFFVGTFDSLLRKQIVWGQTTPRLRGIKQKNHIEVQGSFV